MTQCSPCLRGESEMTSQMSLGLWAKPALGFIRVYPWLKILPV